MHGPFIHDLFSPLFLVKIIHIVYACACCLQANGDMGIVSCHDLSRSTSNKSMHLIPRRWLYLSRCREHGRVSAEREGPGWWASLTSPLQGMVAVPASFWPSAASVQNSPEKRHRTDSFSGFTKLHVFEIRSTWAVYGGLWTPVEMCIFFSMCLGSMIMFIILYIQPVPLMV